MLVEVKTGSTSQTCERDFIFCIIPAGSEFELHNELALQVLAFGHDPVHYYDREIVNANISEILAPGKDRRSSLPVPSREIEKKFIFFAISSSCQVTCQTGSVCLPLLIVDYVGCMKASRRRDQIDEHIH